MKSHRKPTECSGRHRKAIAGHRGSPESVAELRKAPEQYRSASEAYAEHRKAIAGHRGSPERLRKASEGFGRRREASEGFGKAPEGVGGLRETSEGIGRRRGAPERRRRAPEGYAGSGKASRSVGGFRKARGSPERLRGASEGYTKATRLAGGLRGSYKICWRWRRAQTSQRTSKRRWALYEKSKVVATAWRGGFEAEPCFGGGETSAKTNTSTWVSQAKSTNGMQWPIRAIPHYRLACFYEVFASKRSSELGTQKWFSSLLTFQVGPAKGSGEVKSRKHVETFMSWTSQRRVTWHSSKVFTTQGSGKVSEGVGSLRGASECVGKASRSSGKASRSSGKASECYAEHRKAPERRRKASEGYTAHRKASERRRGAPERHRKAARSIGSCAEDLSYSRKSRRRRGDISDKTKSAFRCTDNLRRRARHLRKLTAGQTLRLAKSYVSFGRNGLANRFLGEPAFGEPRAFASLRRQTSWPTVFSRAARKDFGQSYARPKSHRSDLANYTDFPGYF